MELGQKRLEQNGSGRGSGATKALITRLVLAGATGSNTGLYKPGRLRHTRSSAHPDHHLSSPLHTTHNFIHLIMTRTERATSLRAILKDRSESKTGIDKHMPKNGAGTHNWGSLMDERELEEAAVYDEERDRESATEEGTHESITASMFMCAQMTRYSRSAP